VRLLPTVKATQKQRVIKR